MSEGQKDYDRLRKVAYNKDPTWLWVLRVSSVLVAVVLLYFVEPGCLGFLAIIVIFWLCYHIGGGGSASRMDDSQEIPADPSDGEDGY